VKQFRWATYGGAAIALGAVVAGVGAWRWWLQASQPVGAGAPVVVQVSPGTPAQAIGKHLVEEGAIRSARAWRVWTWHVRYWQREPGGFQAGTYRLHPDQPLAEVAGQVWRGDVARVRVTVPEGWTRQAIAGRLGELMLFEAEAFVAATEQTPPGVTWLPPDLPHLEGYLYPDTYEFALDATPEEVVARMLARFAEVALPLYAEQSAARSDGAETPATASSLHEWVTLASIVEKEAAVAAERGRIAGVFHNRLERGMRLEADPTVEYGLQIQQTRDRPLTLEQVRTPSPYNTYLVPGLPPTPIASPGRASLQAAIAPEETEALFFVARYDGTHVFSRTLAEHRAARRRLQRP